MSQGTRQPRRHVVERGIYRRTDRDGNTAFEIGFRDAQGKQRWRTVDGGITAARAALAQAHAARSRGERLTAHPRLRYDDAAKARWAGSKRDQAAGRNAVRLRAVRQYLDAEFGGRRMTDISPVDVAAFVPKQQAAGLKGWTIKGQLTVLRSIFTYRARHLGLVGVNPVSLLDRVERPSSDDERPKRILTADELRRLIAAVEPEFRLVRVRRADRRKARGALGVVWDEIDLEAATVTFTHQLDRNGNRMPLKTKRSRRCIEVTPTRVAALRAHKLASPRSGKYDLAFVNRQGRGHTIATSQAAS